MHISLVNIAYAEVPKLVKNINRVIVNPVIILIFSLALIYFVYGLLVFLINNDNQEARTAGKTHMLSGVLGMFIMIAVYAIMNIILSTLGAHGINVQTGEVNLQ